jgi:acyl-CoA thioester hydrolase
VVKPQAMNTALPYPQPYQGHFDGHRHMFALRVYYEDTDFSGVVYHARYLHFMERARSDMLARVGIDQRAAHEAGEGAYAVTQINMKYRRAAHFDDALLISSTVEKIRGASIDIHQIITRGEEVIISADVTAAFVAPGGRARRQPKTWVAAFGAIMDKQEITNKGTT